MEDYPGNGSPTMGSPPTRLQQVPDQTSSSSPRPNGAARHSKRLTLNFPINLPNSTTDPVSSPGSMTPISHSARQSPGLPATATGTPVSFDEQDETSSLLTAIASQERKVLELREELQNSESELAALKRQWTSSEKTRKRTEISHHAEPLLPLKSPERTSVEEPSPSHRRNQSVAATPDSVASARASRDLDRRHSMRPAAAAGSAVSANGRRVFQGSHARTLSLLSAASDSAYRKPTQDLEQSRPDPDRIARVPRAATLPSVERSTEPSFRAPDDHRPVAEDISPQWRNAMPPQSRDALMRTGKQMASDLREGLWTFLEDIRQATVGEEGINGTETRGLSPAPPSSHPRKRSSHSSSSNRLSVHGARSSRSSRSSHGSRSPAGRRADSGKDTTKSTDIDASFWNEFGIDTPQTSSAAGNATNRPETEAETKTAGEAGDNWDWDNSSTPQPSSATATNNSHTPSSSRSTLESKQQSPLTQASSPRTSASFGDWNPALSTIPDPSVSDGIPWPAINKPFASSKLTRTASNLMDEWERSLSPSPERRLSRASSQKRD